MAFFRDLRLIPVVAFAAAALFVLKATAIVIEGGYTLISSRVALAQGLGEGNKGFDIPPPAALDDASPASRGNRMTDGPARVPTNSWVRDIYDPGEYTGSVAAPKPEAKSDAAPAAAPATGAAATAAPVDAIKPTMTAGERAVLESLQQRRQELEGRSRELEVRDSLLKAAEKRIEQRLQELREMESRVTGAEKKKDEEEAGKFKSLVSMYENMKAKDAAKVFDRLDLRILVEVVNAMNARRMSDILGLMAPEAAERLTIEIANRSGAIGKAAAPAELPKIEGRPKPEGPRS
jgi:flagellar motility protein MotE (MotC chaperone)